MALRFLHSSNRSYSSCPHSPITTPPLQVIKTDLRLWPGEEYEMYLGCPICLLKFSYCLNELNEQDYQVSSRLLRIYDKDTQVSVMWVDQQTEFKLYYDWVAIFIHNTHVILCECAVALCALGFMQTNFKVCVSFHTAYILLSQCAMGNLIPLKVL